MTTIHAHETWTTYPILDRGSMLTDCYKENIIEPAENALREAMIRMPVVKLVNLCKPVAKTFNDSGRWPLRFKSRWRNRIFGSMFNLIQVLPFITETNDDGVTSKLNPNYESTDLVQINQRLKACRQPPEFETIREDVCDKHGLWRTILTVKMRGFRAENWDYEVVRVSDVVS